MRKLSLNPSLGMDCVFREVVDAFGCYHQGAKNDMTFSGDVYSKVNIGVLLFV